MAGLAQKSAMPKIIFLLAGLAGAAGAVLVALGIPIQQFGLGNTLIGSGLVAMIGALVLFALGAVSRELQGIRELLERQVTGKRAFRANDAPDHRPAAYAKPSSFMARRERASLHEPERLPAFERVVKSGVVDGLVYTLYADGSIDAELEEGTLRFGSVDQLRDYLRKSA